MNDKDAEESKSNQTIEPKIDEESSSDTSSEEAKSELSYIKEEDNESSIENEVGESAEDSGTEEES